MSTTSEGRVPAKIRAHLRCPRCRAALTECTSGLECACCHRTYPMLDGMPMLIDEARSVFTVETLARGGGFFRPRSRWLMALDRFTPSLALNVSAARNTERLRSAVRSRNRDPIVLVIGGAIPGKGMHALLSDSAITLVETDVSRGPRTQVVCDAHDLPFADGTFDAVVAQAVLEHVVDPWRCVDEIHRVLCPGGLVYADVAFMQPVHGGRYDFFRFSRAGLLQLFAEFDELDSGLACGPGSALAYAITYFVQSFFRPGLGRKVAGRIGRLIGSPYKYLDPYLARRETALDGASALYFYGQRADLSHSPRELVVRYRGGA